MSVPVDAGRCRPIRRLSRLTRSSKLTIFPVAGLATLTKAHVFHPHAANADEGSAQHNEEERSPWTCTEMGSAQHDWNVSKGSAGEAAAKRAVRQKCCDRLGESSGRIAWSPGGIQQRAK